MALMNIDPMENFPVNDEVILFQNEYNQLEESELMKYNQNINEPQDYSCLNMYSYDNTLNESIFNNYNYDGKICMLVDIISYCGTLSNENREIINIITKIMPYIHKKKPSFDELLSYPDIPELINVLEGVDIKNDDPMFMTYYRVLRYLKN